jgi:hypothetical protein
MQMYTHMRNLLFIRGKRAPVAVLGGNEYFQMLKSRLWTVCRVLKLVHRRRVMNDM